MPRIRTDFEQQTDAWYFERLGKFSGSNFHIFLGNSQTKEDALWEKVAERKWLDTDVEQFFNQYTERGKILEHEARRLYSAVYEAEVQTCGLVEEDGEFDTWAVCSPDGLIGEDGLLEIKCYIAKNFLQISDPHSKKYEHVKPEVRTQIQYDLFVTDRQWAHLCFYHPRGGLHVIRIDRDEEYIEKIKSALRECIQFIKERI